MEVTMEVTEVTMAVTTAAGCPGLATSTPTLPATMCTIPPCTTPRAAAAAAHPVMASLARVAAGAVASRARAEVEAREASQGPTMMMTPPVPQARAAGITTTVGMADMADMVDMVDTVDTAAMVGMVDMVGTAATTADTLEDGMVDTEEATTVGTEVMEVITAAITPAVAAAVTTATAGTGTSTGGTTTTCGLTLRQGLRSGGPRTLPTRTQAAVRVMASPGSRAAAAAARAASLDANSSRVRWLEGWGKGWVDTKAADPLSRVKGPLLCAIACPGFGRV